MVLDLIQKPLGTLDILLYLSKKGRSDVTTIIGNLGLCNRTFYSAADRLKSLGFVFEETEKGWPTRVYYQLTYKGKDAAKLIQPLEGFLKESVEAQWRTLEELRSKRKTKANKRRMLDVLRVLQEATFDLGDWDKTLELSAEAQDLASSLEDDRSLSFAYRYAGLVYQKKNDEDACREYLDKSIEISERTDDWEGAAEDYYILGALFERKADLDEAFEAYSKSREYSERVDSRVGKVRADLGLGRVLGRRGLYKDSLSVVRKAVEEFEMMDEVDELARAYGALGATMFFIDKKKALEYHKKSVEVSRRTGEIRIRAIGLTNASSCYIDKGELNNAFECLVEAEDILRKLDDRTALINNHSLRGTIYGLQGEWENSEESFQQSIGMAEELGAKYHLGDALFHYGQILLEKGDTVRSESILRRALRTFEGLENETKVAKVMETLQSFDSQ